MDLQMLWDGLGWPLVRLLFYVSLGLFIANLIEALSWTHVVGRFAAPLVRLARLQDISGASFSLAFFSGVSANTMLSESFEKGQLSRKELILSNLFNSLPTYFLHLPTMFFITLPFIGSAAVVYVGLTLISAFLRTGFIVLWGRLTLPPLPEGCIPCRLEEQVGTDFKQAFRRSWKRFVKRIRRIILYTTPIYTLVFFLNTHGYFAMFQDWLGSVVGELAFLPPEAMGIVVFHVAAEFTAGLAAAGALLHGGGLGVREIVLALLVGNVLSTPMRAFRHQFPYYAGIFKPRMAAQLIIFNQTLRALSIILVGTAYYFLGNVLGQ